MDDDPLWLEILAWALYVASAVFVLWLGVLILLLPLWGVGKVFGVKPLTQAPGKWAFLPFDAYERFDKRRHDFLDKRRSR